MESCRITPTLLSRLSPPLLLLVVASRETDGGEMQCDRSQQQHSCATHDTTPTESNDTDQVEWISSSIGQASFVLVAHSVVVILGQHRRAPPFQRPNLVGSVRCGDSFVSPLRRQRRVKLLHGDISTQQLAPHSLEQQRYALLPISLLRGEHRVTSLLRLQSFLWLL